MIMGQALDESVDLCIFRAHKVKGRLKLYLVKLLFYKLWGSFDIRRSFFREPSFVI